MQIIALCGAGLGSSGILKVNAERVLGRMGREAVVTATDIAGIEAAAKTAQIILTSPELRTNIPKTWADVIEIHNYFDLTELETKLRAALD